MKGFFLILGTVVALSNAGKISPSLATRLENGEILDVIIQLPSISDVFQNPEILSITSNDARTQKMVAILKERSSLSRAPFVHILTSLGRGNQKSITDPVWINHNFEVKNLDKELAATILSQIPGDYIIREQGTAALIEPVRSRSATPAEVNLKQNQVQWGVEKINAPKVWNATTKGEGIIIAIIDTGVFLEHEALQESYGGAWLDPHYESASPDDFHSHGTHCIGSAVGSVNGIGVAPEAKWIACRGLSDTGTTTETLLGRCAQFMLTTNPRPHIVTNSWKGMDNWDPTFFNDEISAWSTSGIIPVFAIGNSGPNCGTSTFPGNQLNVISVGATDIFDGIADFSSRGNGATALNMKPELSSPGAGIVSASRSGPRDYSVKDGTSMATPHVAGAIALILAENPGLSFNAVLNLLQQNTEKPPVNPADQACSGGGSLPDFPNNAFGAGRVDIARSMGIP